MGHSLYELIIVWASQSSVTHPIRDQVRPDGTRNWTPARGTLRRERIKITIHRVNSQRHADGPLIPKVSKLGFGILFAFQPPL